MKLTKVIYCILFFTIFSFDLLMSPVYSLNIEEDDLEDDVVNMENANNFEGNRYLIDNLKVDARCAIAIDGETNQILFAQNAFEIFPMASTTKIMTALIAINYGDLDREVVISKNAASIRGSKVGYSEGENIKMKELIFGLMFKSGNDAAIAIAEDIGGSIEGFSKIMNDFANSLFMPKNMVEAAEGIMEEKLYHCDIGRFNNQSFTYIAAFGLFTDVAYQTDQDLKNILGHVAYLLEGVKRLFDIKFYHMKIQSEELTVEDDFIYGMVTNSRSVGGFKNLTGKNVDMNDGLFEVTMIRQPKNPLELQEIMTAMLTAEDNTDMIYSFKSAQLTITSEEVIPWTLDGEFGGEHTQVKISNCHEALNLYLKSTKDEDSKTTGFSALINKKENNNG